MLAAQRGEHAGCPAWRACWLRSSEHAGWAAASMLAGQHGEHAGWAAWRAALYPTDRQPACPCQTKPCAVAGLELCPHFHCIPSPSTRRNHYSTPSTHPLTHLPAQWNLQVLLPSNESVLSVTPVRGRSLFNATCSDVDIITGRCTYHIGDDIPWINQCDLAKSSYSCMIEVSSE